MKNLARSEPFSDADLEEVTAIAKAELEAAGIETYVMPFAPNRTKVPSKAVGGIAGWSFRRAWYYWVAEGPGIPVEAAEKLHATHGKEVRVAGHCGCPSPREWFGGFGVGSYHVDTQEGLNALAATLRSIDPPQR
jgi:hypothetical protein